MSEDEGLCCASMRTSRLPLATPGLCCEKSGRAGAETVALIIDMDTRVGNSKQLPMNGLQVPNLYAPMQGPE